MPDTENFGLGDYSTGRYIEKIMMQVQEKEEEFIFQTIRPYCEIIAEMRITKDELKRAMMLLKQQEPVEPIGEREELGLKFFGCGNCENVIRKPWKYCPYCGRAVKWDD